MRSPSRSVLSFAIIAMLALVPSTASAESFTLEHIPSGDGIINSTTSQSFDFEIESFTPGDVVNFASLQFNVEDTRGGGHDQILVTLDGDEFDFDNAGHASESITMDFGTLNLVSRLDDGKLRVTFSAGADSNKNGEYILNWVKLTGDYTPAAGDTVPEPTALMLMGLALLGAGYARRRNA